MDPQSVIPDDVAEDPDSSGFTLTHQNGLVVDFAIDCEDWQSVFTAALKDKCIAILEEVVRHEGYDDITIAVLLTDDDHIARMNKTHRGKDGATDVLSFPDDDDDFLGDIALGYSVIEKQASEMGITMANHVLHLLVHGTLHLTGHDHIDHDEAEIMEGIEIKILAHHGLTNPYANPPAHSEAEGVI